MHIDITLTPMQLHMTYFALAAVAGLITMILSLTRPTLMSALVMFGGPFARMLVVSAYFLVIAVGFHGQFVDVLGYISVFLFSQLAVYFIGTSFGASPSKRARREGRLFSITAVLIGALSFFGPFAPADMALLFRVLAVLGFFTYWKFAGMVAESLSHIDDTAWDGHK